MKKRTLRDVDVLDRRVLMRVDFNVPLLEDRTVADDGRIRAAIPSIRYVSDQGGTVVLMSHLGRPKGTVKPELSLRPVAERLGELLGAPVRFFEECVGPEIEKRVAELPMGEVVLLENLRFHAEETGNDPAFAAALARLGDVYVNDAFGTAHRAHASTVGVTAHFTVRAAGFLMEKEIDYLSRLLESPEHPFTAVLGGAKISGKIDVIRNLAGRVDRLLIGGGMAGTFYAAKGWETGDSLVEEDRIEVARDLLAALGEEKLVLPGDGVAASAFAEDAERRIVAADRLEKGWRFLDIGPETVKRYAAELEKSRTVFWNGPMGVFEMEPFAAGTRALAEAMARATEAGAVTVVGGGDSARAVREAGAADRVTHVSTGGGASLEFVEGKELPGVTALTDR
ncbi:MAG: phosphoglycerate kinase [Candidatus Eisenbacteria bacterium]|nr:phosphoglycerate kinase [Candidatus Eisenbacteria bacterium]